MAVSQQQWCRARRPGCCGGGGGYRQVRRRGRPCPSCGRRAGGGLCRRYSCLRGRGRSAFPSGRACRVGVGGRRRGGRGRCWDKLAQWGFQGKTGGNVHEDNGKDKACLIEVADCSRRSTAAIDAVGSIAKEGFVGQVITAAGSAAGKVCHGDEGPDEGNVKEDGEESEDGFAAEEEG